MWTTISFQPATSIETVDCVAQCVPFQAKDKCYMSLTGRFPHKSSSDNKCILVVYD